MFVPAQHSRNLYLIRCSDGLKESKSIHSSSQGDITLLYLIFSCHLALWPTPFISIQLFPIFCTSLFLPKIGTYKMFQPIFFFLSQWPVKSFFKYYLPSLSKRGWHCSKLLLNSSDQVTQGSITLWSYAGILNAPMLHFARIIWCLIYLRFYCWRQMSSKFHLELAWYKAKHVIHRG